MTTPAQVAGFALWTPRHATWGALRDDVASPAALRPACAGVPPSLLRGASAVTCAALDALRQAAAAGGAELREAATVFGSTVPACMLSSMSRGSQTMMKTRVSLRSLSLRTNVVR